MADVTKTFDTLWLLYPYSEDTCHDFDLSNEWGDGMSSMGGLASQSCVNQLNGRTEVKVPG